MWENIPYETNKPFPINTAFHRDPVGLTFTNIDFNADKDLPINHKKKTNLVTAKLYDPSGRERNTSNYFQIVDEDNCMLINGGDLEDGVWLLILNFMYL